MYDLTVIIPPYREEARLRHIITRVDAVLKLYDLHGEILIVDDYSPELISAVNEVKKSNPHVNIIDPSKNFGRSKFVIDGFTQASSDILLVINSVPSFNCELIPVVYKEIIKGYDFVIGSRYIDAVGVQKMPHQRIPLVVLDQGNWEKSKVILFDSSYLRTHSGIEKLKKTVAYVLQITEISLFSILHHESAAWRKWNNLIKYSLVGLSGIFVNMGVLIILKEYAGFSIPLASVFAIELSILSNFLLNDNWTFHNLGNNKLSKCWHRFLLFQLISVGGLLINFFTLNLLTSLMGVDYRVANVIGILIVFGWNFNLNWNLTWMKIQEQS